VNGKPIILPLCQEAYDHYRLFVFKDRVALELVVSNGIDLPLDPHVQHKILELAEAVHGGPPQFKTEKISFAGDLQLFTMTLLRWLLLSRLPRDNWEDDLQTLVHIASKPELEDYWRNLFALDVEVEGPTSAFT